MGKKHFNRREMLKVGALGGLSLSHYLKLQAATQSSSPKRSGIFVFLEGGPSHQDTFDLKPDAPSEYRGEFKPISTSVPGIQICEHLPELAKSAKRPAADRGALTGRQLLSAGAGKKRAPPVEFERSVNHSGKTAFAEAGGTNRDAVGRKVSGPATDLLMVIDCQDALSADVRSSILLIVRAAGV